MVDTIEAIAAGLDVMPWQLLLPDLKGEDARISDKDREQVEQARRVLEGLSAAQRDLFLQDGLVKDLLARPHYPVEKMGPGWAPPTEKRKR